MAETATDRDIQPARTLLLEAKASRPRRAGLASPPGIGDAPRPAASRILKTEATSAYAATFFARGFRAAGFAAGTGATTRGLRPSSIFLASSCRLRAWFGATIG